MLIVDDQPINIQALYRIFAPDHRVLEATSGDKALTLCKEDPPDVILLDVVMPKMDGHEVCTRLQADEASAGQPYVRRASDLAVLGQLAERRCCSRQP